MTNNRYSMGLIIVAVGIVLLLGKLGIFGFFWGLLWPVIILAIGIVLHMLFFGKILPSGVLIPGGILITLSLLFFLCNLIGWSAMQYLWPGYIFAAAVGLYEYFLFAPHKPKGAFIAAILLAVLAALFFGLTLLYTIGIYFIALVLIVGGALMFMKPRRRSW